MALFETCDVVKWRHRPVYVALPACATRALAKACDVASWRCTVCLMHKCIERMFGDLILLLPVLPEKVG